MGDEQVLSARWIFPVSSPPLEGGTIAVREDRIASVEPKGTRTADVDLGNCAVLPGLVNAHTHLDLSGLRGRIPPKTDFIGWLKEVVSHRRAHTPEKASEDIANGLLEALRSGTTLLGDIAGFGASWPTLRDAPCWSVVFREILGLNHQRVMPAWKEAATWLNDRQDSAQCRTGLSPHAPYSVHQSLFRAAGLANSPLAIHLAETREEAELLEKHRGPFVDFLRELNVWDEDGLAPSHDWIIWRSEKAPALLFAHGNYLNPATIIPKHAAVVYCPRTHAAFGHAVHPFREMLERGIRVALGTDSLASNPDLDILAEARFVHDQHPDFAGEKLLRMATLSGAEALGFGDLTGSLEASKSADLVAVPLPDEDMADPYALLFGNGGAVSAPRRTMWRGLWREDKRNNVK